jgi:DNA-binding FrmR family transcriptional regulator
MLLVVKHSVINYNKDIRGRGMEVFLLAECTKDDIIHRLKKIEGQVKGIQKMIENEKSCVDILTQIAAIRAAINKVGVILFENHTRKCLKDALEKNLEDKMIDDLIQVMTKFTK